jgi:hypothetical protein
VCKDCARRPKAEREREEILEELWGPWFQPRILARRRPTSASGMT